MKHLMCLLLRDIKHHLERGTRIQALEAWDRVLPQKPCTYVPCILSWLLLGWVWQYWRSLAWQSAIESLSFMGSLTRQPISSGAKDARKPPLLNTTKSFWQPWTHLGQMSWMHPALGEGHAKCWKVMGTRKMDHWLDLRFAHFTLLLLKTN